MSTKQPIALWLADKLEDIPADGNWLTVNNAAAELRRLYEANQAMLDALKLARLVVNPAHAYGIAIEAAIAKATGETK